MEAKPASESRKRPSSSLFRASADSNGAPNNPKIRRPESPSKRPRPRASGLLMHDLVKDLRSHRVFSPSSELYGDMASQKLGFGFGCAESEEEAKAAGEGLEGFDNSGGVLGEKCSQAKMVSDSDSKDKSVFEQFIRPCFRRKVFKNLASVSYRRLLPYLMDISKQNTSELEIVQRSKADKSLEENILQAVESSQNDESSKLGIDNGKEKLSVECQNDHSNTLQKNVLDCANESVKGDTVKSTSSETGPLSSSTMGADECCSSPFVSIGIQESYAEISCEDQLQNNLEVAVDKMVVKENRILTSSNVNNTMDGAGSEETDNGFLCMVQDGDIATANLSSAASDSRLHKDVDQCHYSEDSKQAKCNGEIEPVIVHPFECKEQNGMKDRKCGNDGEVVTNLGNDLNEVSNLMTPPDAEIFDRFLVEGNEEDRPDYGQQNRDHLNGNQSNKVNQGNASLDYNTRHEFSSKCRGVLKPRSQAKLFKSPGSFSYRRMLPFIMDIAKDNCDTLANGQFKKLEKDSKESSLVTPNNQEISFDKSNSSGFEEKEEDYSAALTVVLPMPVKDPSDDRVDLMSGSEFQLTIKSQKEDQLVVKEVVSDPLSELGRSTDLLTPVQPVRDKEPGALLLCPTNSEASIEEFAISRVRVRSDCIYSSDTDRLQFTQSQRDLVSSRNSSDGRKRGILKRNPRGCRGLCTCLNCTSYRLHAERAFEFSRNQMQDTEELVLELVAELSHLRDILEKSADGDHHHAIHTNQVKEACRKASQVEELAKDHLSHMNYELDIHCRITCLERPRVKFSDHVKEHIVSKPKEDFQDNKVLKH